MAKIKVPEGMLEAAMRASLEAGLAIGPSTELRIPIEAALRWLSENPIEPSLEQSAILRDLACVVSAGYGTHDPTAAAAAAVAHVPCAGTGSAGRNIHRCGNLVSGHDAPETGRGNFSIRESTP